ncbi:hypothetical protein NDU88_005690 [Pleurodeles waltl]|uniref:Uncharacterized protein n=1 Tax=Pleurodeles waltl TaxID=8319 RepID=A0AAV7NRA6_PLEWA|nr:hypothetical protein NDU88_005690 [Pleurodeles waltl]
MEDEPTGPKEESSTAMAIGKGEALGTSVSLWEERDMLHGGLGERGRLYRWVRLVGKEEERSSIGPLKKTGLGQWAWRLWVAGEGTCGTTLQEVKREQVVETYWEEERTEDAERDPQKGPEKSPTLAPIAACLVWSEKEEGLGGGTGVEE